jgi:hypothetical protein
MVNLSTSVISNAHANTSAVMLTAVGGGGGLVKTQPNESDKLVVLKDIGRVEEDVSD